MAGPLTPPPTDVDLQAQQQASTTAPIQVDDTPSSAPAPVADAPPALSSAQDSNTIAFTTISQLASAQEFIALIEFAERAEISCDAPRALSRLFVACPLILAYLIIDDLPLAHTVLNRLPPSTVAQPLGHAVGSLFVALHKKEYRKVYERADSVKRLVSQPDFFDPQLAAVVISMLGVLLETQRMRTFKLLAKAYRSIPIAVAEVYLGYPAANVLEVAQKNGWSFDNTSQILYPVPALSSNQLPSSGPSTLSSFHIVADTVAKLEL